MHKDSLQKFQYEQSQQEFPLQHHRGSSRQAAHLEYPQKELILCESMLIDRIHGYQRHLQEQLSSKLVSQ